MGILPQFTHKRQAEISKQAMEACEHIINEMGAELHDDLVQRLSVLRLHLDKIERSSYHPDETRETVIKMHAEFQRIIETVRSISRRLLPVKMESDTFDKRVEMLCQNLDISGAVRIHTEFSGKSTPLEPLKESYILRMIQELIHNAFRHSSAWYVWVRIMWQPSSLTIEVEDDGAGFARPDNIIARLEQKHNTLRMRSLAIGARIKYKQGKKGLVATINLPL